MTVEPEYTREELEAALTHSTSHFLRLRHIAIHSNEFMGTIIRLGMIDLYESYAYQIYGSTIPALNCLRSMVYHQQWHMFEHCIHQFRVDENYTYNYNDFDNLTHYILRYLSIFHRENIQTFFLEKLEKSLDEIMLLVFEVVNNRNISNIIRDYVVV